MTDIQVATGITFDLPDASFRVNVERRTISGLAVPWRKVARNGWSQWRFEKGSLHWVDEGRVKLNRDHDRSQLIGRALRLQTTDAGLDATFKIAKGTEGDRALELAVEEVLDGFSIEIDFEQDDEWVRDPDDELVRLVKRAKLRGVALTGMPAFDDARVTSVAASREESTMTGTATDPITPAPPAAPDLTAFTAGVSDALRSAVEQAFERLGAPQGRQTVRPRINDVREPAIYTFSGHGPSLVRDAWHAVKNGDPDAKDRLGKFQRQQNEIGASLYAAGASFATGTTGTLPEIIPPGYRPELYVPELMQGRPFVSAVSSGQISDATPFTIPKFVSATGATADHVEGTNPTDGTLDLGSVTVTPGAISGKLVLSREIVDASNPAIDAIAMTAMRESYAQQTEAKVYAKLNGANGQGGTITAGFVPSGAQVATTTGGSVAAGTFGGLELLRGVRSQLALYPFRRFAAPNQMLLSQEATSAFATAEDTQNRPLLPSIGATNAAGLGNAVTQGWSVDGLAAIPAWSIVNNAAGDADVFVFNSIDCWAWESALLSFRFEEKQGPALIELALFGYFATEVLRPRGISAIRHTRGA